MAILVPAQDEDVSTLDGYAYLYPRYEAGLHRFTALTLLEGANHNDSERAAAVSSGCRTRRIGVDSETKDLRIPLSWGTDHTLTFWGLLWDEPGGVADLPLRSGSFSGFERLAITLAPVEGGAPEALSIVLTDEAGHSAVVGLPKLEPLSAGDGYTVFAELSVPLSAFQGVDLDRVARLSFTAERGAVWIASVWGDPASRT